MSQSLGSRAMSSDQLTIQGTKKRRSTNKVSMPDVHEGAKVRKRAKSDAGLGSSQLLDKMTKRLSGSKFRLAIHLHHKGVSNEAILVSLGAF